VGAAAGSRWAGGRSQAPPPLRRRRGHPAAACSAFGCMRTRCTRTHTQATVSQTHRAMLTTALRVPYHENMASPPASQALACARSPTDLRMQAVALTMKSRPCRPRRPRGPRGHRSPIRGRSEADPSRMAAHQEALVAAGVLQTHLVLEGEAGAHDGARVAQHDLERPRTVRRSAVGASTLRHGPHLHGQAAVGTGRVTAVAALARQRVLPSAALQRAAMSATMPHTHTHTHTHTQGMRHGLHRVLPHVIVVEAAPQVVGGTLSERESERERV
jgi:hypothetical protein